MRRRHREQLGFSFIEVLIVVVIIGILASAVTLSTRHYLERAKVNRARADLATFRSALESYYGEFGSYPSTDQGLSVLAPRFVEKLRHDPWNRPYQYVQPGREQEPYEVICYGADGRPGGEGADADLSTADEGRPAGASPMTGGGGP
ncbi:type II secretion system major pseudopilin GspG [Fontivita pretiosa]|uniref:type II secretion system major pseudopilin GspG n=1 Tax=Fontivita pretiosa TaxID=2989684 RepID=UPI002BF7EDBB|nr:type II secretion system major pseudopilin GspG [Tepidisphaeraceae bacterium]